MNRFERVKFRRQNKQWLIGLVVTTVVALLAAVFAPVVSDLLNRRAAAHLEPLSVTNFAEDYSGQTNYVLINGSVRAVENMDLEVFITNPNNLPMSISKVEVNIKDYIVPEDYQITSSYAAGGEAIYYFFLNLPPRKGKYTARLETYEDYNYLRIEPNSSEMIAIDLSSDHYGVFIYEVEVFYTIGKQQESFMLTMNEKTEFNISFLPRDKIVYFASDQGDFYGYKVEYAATDDQIVFSVNDVFNYLLDNHDNPAAFIDAMAEHVETVFHYMHMP